MTGVVTFMHINMHKKIDEEGTKQNSKKFSEF